MKAQPRASLCQGTMNHVCMKAESENKTALMQRGVPPLAGRESTARVDTACGYL